MEQSASKFGEIILADRDSRERHRWQGTLLNYLDLLREDPGLAKLAHARLYEVITRASARDIHDSDDPRSKRLFKDEALKVYNFFADEFFGIEHVLSKIVRYFHSAALKGEESRQVLYLMGPVGSGKSSLVEKLQHGLEDTLRAMPLRAAP